RGADALAELYLAGENGHRAVRLDAQPAVQHAVAIEAPGQLCSCRLSQRNFREEGEANDQPGTCLEELSAGKSRAHAISFAAFCTARTMRLCEAQRHRWPFSACLISSSVGFGLRS